MDSSEETKGRDNLSKIVIYKFSAITGISFFAHLTFTPLLVAALIAVPLTLIPLAIAVVIAKIIPFTNKLRAATVADYIFPVVCVLHVAFVYYGWQGSHVLRKFVR
ncbi:MAG: hypothetical protein NTV11_19605 [Rhodocyclales bacterium]|nr:hypothetical protein [Rhodocyclales bacterium]